MIDVSILPPATHRHEGFGFSCNLLAKRNFCKDSYSFIKHQTSYLFFILKMR